MNLKTAVARSFNAKSAKMAKVAERSAVPTKMATPVGAQLRWAIGLVRRLSRSVAALLQKWRHL
jgi:hypothetical protein